MGWQLRDSSHDVCEAGEHPGTVPACGHSTCGQEQRIWALQAKQEKPQFKLRLGNRAGSCAKCALHSSLEGIHSFLLPHSFVTEALLKNNPSWRALSFSWRKWRAPFQAEEPFCSVRLFLWL